MEPGILVVVLVVLVVVFVALGLVPNFAIPQGGQKPTEQGFSFKSRPELLTKSEQAFFRNLSQAVGSELVIFGQVRLADVIVVAETDRSRRATANNKIQRKHVDFVLARRSDFSIAAIIELDDPTHKRRDRIASDELKTQALQSAGIPLFRFTEIGSALDIRAELSSVL